MQIYNAPDIKGGFHILDQNESKHLIKVLRMRKGSEVMLIDGKGNLFGGIIEDADPKQCGIRIISSVEGFEKRNYRLHIAISPLKNTERFEWFIEKCVEIGIDEITPMLCRNTEKTSVREDRMNNLIISAMKQSLKAFRPEFHNPVDFNEFISYPSGARKMIAHCHKDFQRKKISDVYSRNEDAIILIGPEGDFTTEEVEKASAAGFENIHLGPSRLRTETAGIAACHSVYFINQ
jgi:16S rRNA (uracil1498-N3)-methyltransferase